MHVLELPSPTLEVELPAPVALVPETETLVVPIEDTPVKVVDDEYSGRIRCDHPPRGTDGEVLAEQLLETADERERGRVVVLAPPAVAEGLLEAGFEEEGRIPGFYEGARDCLVLGAYPDDGRAELARPRLVEEVHELLEQQSDEPPRRPDVQTMRATVEDAPAIAELLGETFAQYPTPSSDPEYVADAIRDGVPFRMVEADGELAACASADLVRAAKTAELTDCATQPHHRGRGYMQAILDDLMDDLRELSYPTAFTLARARIPGVNLAFQRLGFELCGTMPKSCRIGDGIEDMNIWARAL